MQITVMRFDPAPFKVALKRRRDKDLFNAIDEPTFIKTVVLSIIHRHCILMLTDEAALLYESIPISLRNRIDDLVEDLITDTLAEEAYYVEFMRHLTGCYSVRRIMIRNHNTIEVYSGHI